MGILDFIFGLLILVVLFTLGFLFIATKYGNYDFNQTNEELKDQDKKVRKSKGGKK